MLCSKQLFSVRRKMMKFTIGGFHALSGYLARQDTISPTYIRW